MTRPELPWPFIMVTRERGSWVLSGPKGTTEIVNEDDDFALIEAIQDQLEKVERDSFIISAHCSARMNPDVITIEVEVRTSL